MKKYKLLRDLPTHPAGTILTWVDTKNWTGGPYDGGRYHADSLHSKDLDLVYTPHTIENNPDFFELIEEKEFTESDMIEFAKFYWYSERNIADIKMDFQEWLTQRNNGK